MTYREFHDEIQSYLSRHAIVEGYISRQERMADKPCHDAIARSALSDRLSLQETTMCGGFYEVFADVVGHKIRIGEMCNNGTIKKQAVQLHLKNANEYGDKDVEWVFLELARDKFSTLLGKDMEKLEAKREEVRDLEKQVEERKAVLSQIKKDYQQVQGGKW